MADKRRVDLAFAKTEKLWRRVEVKHVSRCNQVKASAIRLQVSVVREKYGSQASVPSGKFNGIAEITAEAAGGVVHGAIRAVCVDEPTKNEPGHALIALVANPGEDVSEDLVNATRAKLAESFMLVVEPKPV